MTDPAGLPSLRRLGASLLCALMVLFAVGLEVVSGQAANSPDDARFNPLVPLGWPQSARVAWWLVVAGAAAGHRLLLDDRRGLRRSVLALLLAVPFVVFAAGIAWGASWSTWH